MYFVALATDYDGTLAADGVVAPATLAALRSFKGSGRKLILVTGRELPDLRRTFDDIDLFDLVVAENGALLYEPATAAEKVLGSVPPPAFIDMLARRNVAPLSIGRSIVATREPNETIVLEIVRDLGLDLQIIFNKGAVMVLPAGVNKATGLAAGLARLKLSPLNVVGVGDAENDHAFLQTCGCAVAVANALPMVKADADIVTNAPRGAGVVELIERLIHNDLADVAATAERHLVELAQTRDGRPVGIHPQAGSLLIAGSSGGGKSTLAMGLLERIAERGFQFCVIDPEGDYAGLEGTVTIGEPKSPPPLHEIRELLEQPNEKIVIDLTGVGMADRPGFFAELMPQLSELRARTARPHWIVIDEAHHLLPAALGSAAMILPRELAGTILITVSPEHIPRSALEAVAQVMTVGADAAKAMRSFGERSGSPAPQFDESRLDLGDALLWDRATAAVRLVSTKGPRATRLRHNRKYAEGELGDDKSFYFRGPDNRLNLKAQNLGLFLQIADGVDDGTWLHHLRAGDYSRWLGSAINDSELAAEIAAIERDTALDAAASRARIKAAIERRYTGPA